MTDKLRRIARDEAFKEYEEALVRIGKQAQKATEEARTKLHKRITETES